MKANLLQTARERHSRMSALKRHCDQVEVLLGGERLRYCFAADTAQGWAKCYVAAPDGGINLDERLEPVVETLTGDVQIVAAAAGRIFWERERGDMLIKRDIRRDLR